ncbi:MAG: nuclear transport factor 2 family protein [Kordiimonadaceae bacterium]|nr:nuclear transport factor 2 family protein [Kordiimonadaceae bacterium]
MSHFKMLILSLLLACTLPVTAANSDTAMYNPAIAKTLDALHAAAASANWDAYFNQYTEDAIFIGTDAGERWDMPTFKGYASKSKGWDYKLENRHIVIGLNQNTAWFDEILHNAKYGTSRGTGVLIRTKSGWKVTQYHLTFPIPNDLTKGITEQIQSFEAKLKP